MTDSRKALAWECFECNWIHGSTNDLIDYESECVCCPHCGGRDTMKPQIFNDREAYWNYRVSLYQWSLAHSPEEVKKAREWQIRDMQLELL